VNRAAYGNVMTPHIFFFESLRRQDECRMEMPFDANRFRFNPRNRMDVITHREHGGKKSAYAAARKRSTKKNLEYESTFTVNVATNNNNKQRNKQTTMAVSLRKCVMREMK
jgi:hypothetical protein